MSDTLYEQVSLAWSAPYANGDPLSGYEIKYSRSSTFIPEEIWPELVTTTQVTIDGLESGAR